VDWILASEVLLGIVLWLRDFTFRRVSCGSPQSLLRKFAFELAAEEAEKIAQQEIAKEQTATKAETVTA
jgi:hypothetical protein